MIDRRIFVHSMTVGTLAAVYGVALNSPLVLAGASTIAEEAVNVKTARALKLTVPHSLLAADRVPE